MRTRFNYDESSDEELVAKHQAGDEEAMVVLYARWAPVLTRQGRQRGLSPADAEGVGHEALTEAVANFDPAYQVRFKTFLFSRWKWRLKDQLRRGPGGMIGFRTMDGTDVERLKEARQRLTSWEELSDDRVPHIRIGEDFTETIASYDWIRWVDAQVRGALKEGPAPARQLWVWVERLRRWGGDPHMNDTELAELFGCNKSTIGRDRALIGRLLQEFMHQLRDEDDIDSAWNGRAITGPEPGAPVHERKEENDDNA